jgi:F-box domain
MSNVAVILRPATPASPESVVVDVVLIDTEERRSGAPHFLENDAATAGSGAIPSGATLDGPVPSTGFPKTVEVVEAGCFHARHQVTSRLRNRTTRKALPTAGITATIDDVPEDVFREILEYLSPKDVVALGLTSRTLAKAAFDPLTWAWLLQRDFQAPSQPMPLYRQPRQATPFSFGSSPLVMSPSPPFSSSSATLALLNGPTSPNNHGPGGMPRSPASASPASPLRSSLRRPPSSVLISTLLAMEEARPATTVTTPVQTPLRTWRSRTMSTRGVREEEGEGTKGGRSGHPMSEYVRLHNEHKQGAARRIRKTKAALQELQAIKRQYTLRVFLDVLQWGCGLGLYPWLLFAWLLLMYLKTSGTYPSLPWTAVWAPVIAAVLWPWMFAAIGAVTECFARRAADRATEKRSNDPFSEPVDVTTIAGTGTSTTTDLIWVSHGGCCYGQDSGDEGSFVEYAQQVKSYRTGKCVRKCRLRCCFFTLPMVCLLLSPIFILLKLEGVGFFAETSYAVSLIPVWMFFLTWCCLPQGGAFPCLDDGEARTMMFFTQACATIVFAPVIAVTAAILDGANIRLIFALLPLFILDVLILGFLIFFALMSCCASSMSDRREARLATCVALTVLAFGLGAQVPASIYWEQGEKDKVAGALLIPAIFFMAIISCLWSGGSVALLRKTRKSSFKYLYTARWRTIDKDMTAGLPKGHGTSPALTSAVKALQ